MLSYVAFWIGTPLGQRPLDNESMIAVSASSRKALNDSHPAALAMEDKCDDAELEGRGTQLHDLGVARQDCLGRSVHCE
jgi:hypothetical protein